MHYYERFAENDKARKKVRVSQLSHDHLTCNLPFATSLEGLRM